MTIDCASHSILTKSNEQSSGSPTRTTLPDGAMIAAQCQRLLQLRHASACQCNTSCPISEFCGKLKKLWPHLLECKNDGCRVPLCTTSRVVLHHYSQCKDDACRICQPARSKRTADDEKTVLEQYKLKAPPTKRVRQSASRASLLVLGATSPAASAAEGNTTDSGSDSERDSSYSYTYSSSSDECKDGSPAVLCEVSSSPNTIDQKAPEMVMIMQKLARVIISTPETF